VLGALLLACADEATILPPASDAGASRGDAIADAAMLSRDASPRDDSGAAPTDATPGEDAALLDTGPRDADPSPDVTSPTPDAGPAESDAGPAPSRVLHVSPQGDDAADGSAPRPLRTIAEGLRRAQAGEEVRVHAGTYAELVSFPRSGLPGQPIVLAAAPSEVVVLDGRGLGRGEAEPALVKIVDREHLVVRGLELRGLTGAGGNFPAGIWVRGTSRNIRLEGNDVHDIRAENGGRDSGAHGIAIYGTARQPSEDVVVIGNRVHDLSLGWSEAVVVNGNVRRFELRDNVVRNVDNIAFDLIGFEADVCPACSQADTISDVVNRARDGLVVGNLAHDMTTFGNPAYGDERSAACYYVDGGADIIIERNEAHDCDLGVELASEHFGKSTRRVIVRSNFIWRNNVTGVATGGYDPGNGAGGGSAEDCQIVNNTIHDSARNGWADTGVLLQNRNVNNVYANNIVVASRNTTAMSASGSRNSGNTFEGNIVFGGGVDGITLGTGSRTVDPQLVAPAQGNLHLAAGSPAREAGRPLTAAVVGTLDVDGDARVVGVLDIGADETR
jgi:hypothetical protein